MGATTPSAIFTRVRTAVHTPDHLMERVRAIEKRLGIETKIAA